MTNVRSIGGGRAYAKGKRVLEAFCHTGAFGMQAASGRAQSVEVDVSAAAVAMAQAHATQNHVAARCTYRQADAFDELRVLEKQSATV